MARRANTGMGDQMKKPTNWDDRNPFPSHAAIMEALRRVRQSNREASERRLDERWNAKVVRLDRWLQRARDATQRSKTTVAHQMLDAMHKEARAARQAGRDVPESHPGWTCIVDADKDFFGSLETSPPCVEPATKVGIYSEPVDRPRGPGGQSSPIDEEE